MEKLVSQLLVKYLEDRDIEHVFGLCGHTNIAVLSELEKSKIDFVNVRHEQTAAHMADGYARVKKKASVMLSHLGPGLTNAATGVANAALDSIPMVVIAGDVPSHYYGKHPHQEVNLHADGSQYEIYRPFVKRAWRLDRPDLFPEILNKGFQLAESGRPGPVLISVPMDMFSKKVDEKLFEKVSSHTRSLHKPSISDQQAKEILERLVSSDQPVIHAGGGVILADADEGLRELSEHFDIPVSHSLMGKGVVPDDSDLVLGMTGFWGTKFINNKTRRADTILALGTQFAEADSSSWEPEHTFDFSKTKLIHIDIEPSEIGRNYPAEIGVVADLKEALTVINRVAKELYPEGKSNQALRDEIAEYKNNFKGQNKELEEDSSFPLMPQRILADVREVLPKDAYITTDVGWNKNGVGQQFPVYTPGSIITPGGYATMGFGAPAAMGAKIAAPDNVVVSLVGDGGFGQNPSILATAVEENIPVVWVIMNNSAFGTIAGLEKAHFDTTYGTIFEKQNGESYSPNYADIAKAYGVEGIKVESAEDFKPALEKAINLGKPVVLDVPMINNPVPTDGHWNIMDIYSPGKKVHHASVN